MTLAVGFVVKVHGRVCFSITTWQREQEEGRGLGPAPRASVRGRMARRGDWEGAVLLAERKQKAYAVCPGFASSGMDVELAILARIGSEAIEPPPPKE